MTETTIPRPVYKPGMSAGLRELCDHCCADIKWLEGEIDRLCHEREQIDTLLNAHQIAMPGGANNWTLVQRVEIACVAATEVS